MKIITSCQFSTYGVPCGATVEHGSYFCENHKAASCVSCSKPSTHGCDYCGQFVCGAPLCNDCTDISTEHGHRHGEKPEIKAARLAQMDAWGVVKDGTLSSAFTTKNAAIFTIGTATGGELIRLVPDPNWNGE